MEIVIAQKYYKKRISSLYFKTPLLNALIAQK